MTVLYVFVGLFLIIFVGMFVSKIDDVEKYERMYRITWPKALFLYFCSVTVATILLDAIATVLFTGLYILWLAL